MLALEALGDQVNHLALAPPLVQLVLLVLFLQHPLYLLGVLVLPEVPRYLEDLTFPFN